MAIRRTSLITTIVTLGLMFAAEGAMAYTAKPIYFKNYSAGSFINTTFTFDIGPDSLATETGYDNIGGPYLSQVVDEYYDADESCTAADNGIGEEFYLYEAFAVTTYINGGQVYGYADEGTECINLTSGVLSGSNPFYIIGGSGKFAGASGSGEGYFTGQLLGTPAIGFFGSVQTSAYGTMTP